MILLGNPNSTDDEDLLAKYRLISLKTLKAISLELLENIFVEKYDRKSIPFLDPLFVFFSEAPRSKLESL